MTRWIWNVVSPGSAAGFFLVISLAWAPAASADIFEAAAECDPQALRAAIAAGEDPKAADDDGGTILHWAARNSGDACVKILLEHKPDLNARNHDGETPFMKAVISSADEEGALRSAQLLIDAGADISIPNRFGYSPLFALIVYGNGMTLVLDPSLMTPAPDTGIPPYKGSEYQMAKLLLDKGADPNALDEGGQSAMQFAAQMRSPALIDLLVAHGGNLQFKEPTRNRSLLHIAAQADRIVNIPYLLKHGLDIDAQDQQGATPLMLAVAYEKPGTVKALLKAGANAEIPDSDGFPPLLHAVNNRMLAMTEVLLNGGAKADVQTSKSRNTGLQIAAHLGWLDGVKLLLDKGADPKIASVNGMTALDFAKQQGHTDIVSLLEKRQ
jgi:ankyrin repeat protein